MFESLSDRLSGVFDRLRGRGALNEADVRGAMREVRVALLEADVALAGRARVCRPCHPSRRSAGRCCARSRPASRSSRSSTTPWSRCVGAEEAGLDLAVTPCRR